MTDRTWVRVISWHGIRIPSPIEGVIVTMCGRVAVGEISNTLPAGKTCESCLRIIAREDEA